MLITLDILETNSYIEYTLDVKEAGTYNLSMNIAQESADRTFDVYVDDVKVSTINVTSSGSWTVFNPYSTQIKFDNTGKKKLKLVASGSMNPSGINLTKIAQQETTVDNKKCDLIVTGINTDKTYYAGEEVQFVATIKNIGEAASRQMLNMECLFQWTGLQLTGAISIWDRCSREKKHSL